MMSLVATCRNPKIGSKVLQKRAQRDVDSSALNCLAAGCIFILCVNLWRYFHLMGDSHTYGDTVNLSRCFYSPAILTSCVNPQRKGV